MGKRFVSLCLAVFLSAAGTAAWALSEVGGVYQIGSAQDLKAFAEFVNDGNPYANAVLTADIDKGGDLTMIGKDGLDYQGSFDGQGYTITIDAINQDHKGTAIFRNVGVNALIQNLKVQGKIRTNQQHAAGIAVWSSGTIRGCYSDIEITSAVAGDATHAGIVAVAYTGTFVEDCLAKIVIKGAQTENCGGIVGWCNNPSQITNSLVISDGSDFNLKNGGSNNIGRNDGNVIVVDLNKYNQDIYGNRPQGACYNNYVTNQWGTNKATTVVAYNDLADGRICYQLNNDQSHISWAQEIGVDPFPVPAAFGGSQVYASAPTNCSGKAEGTELTFSNSGTAQATPHAYDKFGICSVCGCFDYLALERDATDGCLLLKSARDIDLAECLNRFQGGGKFNLKMAEDIEYIAEPGRYIFNEGNWFDGNFNGDGHQLTIEMSDMGNNASLFPNFGGVYFENVIMHGTITTTGQFAGSITSHTRRGNVVVRNVFSDIDINCSLAGDNTNGGLFGVVEDKTQVENTIYAGNINGNGNTACLAGFCGWSGGTTYYTNCAFLGTLNDAIGDSKTLSRNPGQITLENVYIANSYGHEDESKEGVKIIKDPNDIESGALAYALNSNQGGAERFYQKIGEDLFPMPIKKEGALVYAVSAEYRCDGQPIGSDRTFSNSPNSGTIPPHEYEEGFCTVCGTLQEDYMTPVDGWFDISNGAELLWWSHYAAKHLDVSARLTDNIDMDGYSERWAQVGTEGKPFYGNFDGQNHVISNLVVNMPGSNGIGLISVMNSQPSKGFGNLNDESARNAEGVYIKNVVLDESCSLTGKGYVALVGMTAPWAGHVTIEGVMMCGDVTAADGPNAAGVFGCVMSSACHVTINNCGMVGNVYGSHENGSFSGWLGDWAEVTNCFAVGSVEGYENEGRYFARYGDARVNDNIKNCYALYGKQEHVGLVTEEDFESGALAWKANGEQFRTGYWFQNLGEDMYPYPDPTHGTVIYAAEEYFSIQDEADIENVADAIRAYEEDAASSTVATQALLDNLSLTIEALYDATTIAGFADAIDTMNVAKQRIAENAAIYKAFADKCDEILAQLEADDSFQGSLRESLYAYLTENDEPSEENPLGTYSYIVEEHVATGEEVSSETARVVQWLADAIAEDYKAGTDISRLIPNGDFSEGREEKWTGAKGFATGDGKLVTDDPQAAKIIGIESWDATGDMYQTIEGLKPGYYLIGTHAAFRPSDDRYSTNYAAGIYANGVFNYFPTVFEDPVLVNDTVDQVNCNLHGTGALDLPIYDDEYSTDDSNSASIVGYVSRGPSGMAAAANAGRYPVYTIGYVGADGKLTIGIKNPGTKYASDWTAWTALSMKYSGEDAAEASDDLDIALENMAARAQTLLGVVIEEFNNPAQKPNYPSELRDSLEEALQEVGATEDKAALAAKFSSIFGKIYEGKQAYIQLGRFAKAMENISIENPSVTEKDEEGHWLPATGEKQLFSTDEQALFDDAYADLTDAFLGGTYSTEEALSLEALSDPAFEGLVATQDEDGNFLIGNAKQYVFFSSYARFADNYAKAKLTDDIDLYGIVMQPIAPAGGEDIRFRGTFDGQNHAIKNLYMDYNQYKSGAESCSLFGIVDGATIKNLKITGELFSDGKFMAGVAGKAYNTKIDNCEVEVTMTSTVEGDGTHGGIIGVNDGDGTVISNCLVNCTMLGENTNSCGGVIGWSEKSSQVNGTLILSTFTIGEANSNIVSRKGENCSVSNVFYLNSFGGSAGTKVTEEELADGSVAYRLNGSKSEGELAWFQTIGTDALPHLNGGDIVYYYGGEYFNEKPNPQLNAFAYNLEANLTGSQVVVSFSLNAEAKSVKVNFYDGDALVHSEASAESSLAAGQHTIRVAASELGSDPKSLSYEVEVQGAGSLDALKIGESYKFSSPYGLAVNNNPASKGFGQVLITETRPTEELAEDMFSADAPGALFAFDAAFQPVGSFYGGLDIAEKAPLKLFGEYELGLKDVRFSQDGRLFVGRASGTSTSSVYELNPDDLSEAWKPVFTGGELDEATGITYVGSDEQNRAAVGLALDGEGDDLKMYVLGVQGGFDKNSDVSTYAPAFNCAVYELGTAKEWSAAPSAYVEALEGVYAGIPTHISISEDGQGGLWFIQSATEHSEKVPSIKHFDAEGNEDYSDATTNTYSGMMATTTDGNYIAFGMAQNKVVLYETNYVPMANGKIWLEPKYNITTSESTISGLAFDYANNLYVASNTSKTLSRYAIPSWNENKSVTPGNAIGEASLQGDVNNDGHVDIADVVSVLNIMAQSGTPDEEPAADVNGDGHIDIADVVSVLNIMAAQ